MLTSIPAVEVQAVGEQHHEGGADVGVVEEGEEVEDGQEGHVEGGEGRLGWVVVVLAAVDLGLVFSRIARFHKFNFVPTVKSSQWITGLECRLECHWFQEHGINPCGYMDLPPMAFLIRSRVEYRYSLVITV